MSRASREKEDLPTDRQRFRATTSNKQLISFSTLRQFSKLLGKQQLSVPDNVLFEVARVKTVRKRLLENTDLHTVLRLPTGIFYANA